MKSIDNFPTKILKSLFDLSRPVIFYGAGYKAPLMLNKLKEIGVEPVCFADKDVKKQGTLCCGKIILPLEEAVKQYRNPQLFITTNENSWADISEDLISGGLVAESQIINKRKYISCNSLEHEFVLYGSLRDIFLSPCCMWEIESRPKIEFNVDDYEETVSRFLELRDKVVENLNSKSPQYCTGCPNLEEKPVSGESRTFFYLNLGEYGVCNFDCCYCFGIGEHGVCNFDCCYCFGKREPFAKKKLLDYSKLLSVLEKRELINDTNIAITSGEITLHPDCDELLSVLEKYPNEKIVFTNASIFNERIANMMKNSNTRLNVSIDAGTKETFARIKGRNMFDKVCENLRKYSGGRGNIELKYLLLPNINDNTEDADGFLKICSEISVSKVILSKNLTDNKKLPEKTIMTARYIYNKALELGFVREFTKILTQDEINSIKNNCTIMEGQNGQS